MPYVPPPLSQVGGSGAAAAFGEEEAWQERAGMVLEDLRLLLSLPHHKFWSQVVYDRSLHRRLGQLVQNLPRRWQQLQQQQQLSSSDSHQRGVIAISFAVNKSLKEVKQCFGQIKTVKAGKIQFSSRFPC